MIDFTNYTIEKIFTEYEKIYWYDIESEINKVLPYEFKHINEKEEHIEKMFEFIDNYIVGKDAELGIDSEFDLTQLIKTTAQKELLIEYINPHNAISHIGTPTSGIDVNKKPAVRDKETLSKINTALKKLEAYDANEFHYLLKLGLVKKANNPLRVERRDERRDEQIKKALDILSLYRTPQWSAIAFPNSKPLSDDTSIPPIYCLDEKGDRLYKEYFQTLKTKLIENGVSTRNAQLIYQYFMKNPITL